MCIQRYTCTRTTAYCCQVDARQGPQFIYMRSFGVWSLYIVDLAYHAIFGSK